MQPTKGKWLELAGPHLDGSSYVHCLLEQQQEQGEEFRVQFFLDGFLKQQEALGFIPESPEWTCSKPGCACAGTSAVVDSASCCVTAVELCSEHVTWDEEGKRMVDYINPYLRVQLASTFGLEQGGSCTKSAWFEDHVYAGTSDYFVTRDKYRDSVSTPMLPGDSVQMYYKDSSDPAAGKWYTGQVVHQAKFDYKVPATLWDSVTVLWEDDSVTKVSPWEVLLLSPMPPGRRSQGLPQQPSFASSSQATALENAQQPQGMAHGTALHPMTAPGVATQGGMGQPGAGPSQGSARAVAGAGAQKWQKWQKESGDFTHNAREEHDLMRAAPTAKGRKKKSGKVQRPRDDDKPASSAPLKQPSRRPATRKAGSRHAASRQSSSLPSGSRPGSSRQADPFPVSPPQGRPPFQSTLQDPPREAYIAPPTPTAVLRTVPSESVSSVIKAFSTPNYKISKPPPGPSRLGVMTHPCYPHGIKWDAGRNKWRVDIVNTPTGACKSRVFSDAASAARYQDKHALQRYGEQACLNFPKGDYMRLSAGAYCVKPIIPSAARASHGPISLGEDVEARNPTAQKQPMSLTVTIADAANQSRRQIFGVFQSQLCANQAQAAAQRLLNGCGYLLPVVFLTREIARGTPVACPLTNPVDFIIRGYYPLIDFSALITNGSPPGVPAHHASSAQPGPTDPAAEPHVGAHTPAQHPPAPPPGARRRVVRKATASSGPAELGRSPAGRGPKQQGSATALAEEEEDWDVDDPPRKRAQQGTGPRAGMKSSAAPRAGKRSPFKGVTLKNKRIAVMLWNGAQKQPIHLSYWPSSLAAARINDIGRITLHGRTGVELDQLNFPLDDYTDEEIPDSIEALQDAIKLDQVQFRAASKPSGRQAVLQRRQRRRCSQQPAPADDSAKSATAEKLRISHFLGVSWNTHSSLWQARFRQPDGTSLFIGHFQEAQAAGRAYDEYALQQGGPAAVRNAMPSTLTGEQGDDEQAHDCLRYHAQEGDSALFDQASTVPVVDPATANGPALANSPGLHLPSTYVPGPVNSRKRSKAAASAGRGKPGTGDAGYGAGVASHGVARQPAGAASQAAGGAASLAPSTPTRRTKRKLPSLAEGGHARVPDSVETGDGVEAPSSQYHGVTWDMQQKQWQVTVMTRRGSIQFGWYSDEEEAACAHDAAAVVIGPQAHLNFPTQNLRVSPATRQMCVDLATGLGLSATFPLSVPAELPQSPDDFNGVSWDCMKGKWHVVVACGEQVVDLGWFQNKLEAARSFDAAAVASKQEGCMNFPQEEIWVSNAVRQRCVALALHLGHSSSATQSIGVKHASNKGKVQPRQELTYDELASASRGVEEQPVLKAAKRRPHASPSAIRHGTQGLIPGVSKEEAEAIEDLTSLQNM